MPPSQLSKTDFISRHDEGAVYEHPVTQQQLFIAVRAYAAGETICTFSARETATEPSRYTVQAGEHTHIFLYPEHLQYINHSCDPNAFFNTDLYQLKALKPIEEGDEITFFYPSTEWKMAESFSCFCGTERCIKTISGASQIPIDLLKQYQLTSFIKSKLDSNQSK